MQFTRTTIADVIVIEPKVFGDARGFFMDSYNAHALSQFVGQEINLWRECHSKSAIHVLRGLHIQTQLAKLVRCVHGRLFDVVVDARRESPTCGQWVGYELSADNKRQLYIPHGFLHGFFTLSDGAELCYKVDDAWNPNAESAVVYNDPQLAIDWQIPHNISPILSQKDENAMSFAQFMKSQSH